MTALATLRPSRTFDQLFAPGVVYAPRTSIDNVTWVLEDAFRLDTLTGMTLLVAGSMPLVCHENTVTPAALAFFERCGFPAPSRHLPYRTQDQAFELARQQVGRGRRLACPYPLPLSLCDQDALLVPTALYNWLNDKSNLDELIDAELLAPAVMLKPAAVQQVLTVFPGQPVFVKACVAGASGAGVDVRYGPDDDGRQEALSWLNGHAGRFSGVRVELALEIVSCWCLNLAIRDDRIEYLGAALQQFGTPGQQTGSLIDPGNEPPASAVDVVMHIAEKAQRLGYRGLAGFDLGLTPEARPYVFDLNFRMVSSTVQLLLHQSAVERVGASVSASWHELTHGPLAPALAALDRFGQAGQFVPYRLWDACPESRGRSMLTGFLVGASIESIEQTRQAMASALGDLLV